MQMVTWYRQYSLSMVVSSLTTIPSFASRMKERQCTCPAEHVSAGWVYVSVEITERVQLRYFERSIVESAHLWEQSVQQVKNACKLQRVFSEIEPHLCLLSGQIQHMPHQTEHSCVRLFPIDCDWFETVLWKTRLSDVLSFFHWSVAFDEIQRW